MAKKRVAQEMAEKGGPTDQSRSAIGQGVRAQTRRRTKSIRIGQLLASACCFDIIIVFYAKKAEKRKLVCNKNHSPPKVATKARQKSCFIKVTGFLVKILLSFIIN